MCLSLGIDALQNDIDHLFVPGPVLEGQTQHILAYLAVLPPAGQNGQNGAHPGFSCSPPENLPSSCICRRLMAGSALLNIRYNHTSLLYQGQSRA